MSALERAAVDRWLDAYVEAWTSYDPEQIGALFADEVTYRYHPYDEPIRGREAVVASWLGEGEAAAGASTRDEPGTYEATYRTVAVEGDTAIATGSTSYRQPGGPVERVFDNCFVMGFDEDGRCTEFIEWYMERPPARLGH
jgi:ketosteroid isomerase-like protein